MNPAVPHAPKGALRSDDCFCESCWQPGTGGSMCWPMFLCDTCGNKRCPRATHHDNECTGSNEPGQPGSSYTRTM